MDNFCERRVNWTSSGEGCRAGESLGGDGCLRDLLVGDFRFRDFKVGEVSFETVSI